MRTARRRAPPKKRIRVAELARQLNTDRMVSPALVRQIQMLRAEEANA